MMKNKIDLLKDILKKTNVDALLITSKINIYWLTSFATSSGYLFVTKNDVSLCLDKRYEEASKNNINNANRIIINAFEKDINNYIQTKNIKSIGFENDFMTFDFVDLIAKKFKVKMYPAKFEALRNIKYKDEIDNLRKSANIADKAFENVLKNIDVGMTEIEIEDVIFETFKQEGADRIFPRAIINSGIKGALPHGKPTNKKIKEGELVTIDFGCVYKGYYSDMTRTIAMGKVEEKELLKIYEIVKEAQSRGIIAIKPGVKCKDVHAVCFDYIKSKGYEKYFIHQTGHGIGLKVHEKPRIASYSDEILQEGHVITIEPGIYLPLKGGVRIEDDIVVTKDGCEVLTKSSKDLIVI